MNYIHDISYCEKNIFKNVRYLETIVSSQVLTCISRKRQNTLIKIIDTRIPSQDLQLTRFTHNPLSLLLPFSHVPEVLVGLSYFFFRISCFILNNFLYLIVQTGGTR
jgi:hypothetical protein